MVVTPMPIDICWFYFSILSFVRNDNEWKISTVWPDGDFLLSSAGSAVLLVMPSVSVHQGLL